MTRAQARQTLNSLQLTRQLNLQSGKQNYKSQKQNGKATRQTHPTASPLTLVPTSLLLNLSQTPVLGRHET